MNIYNMNFLNPPCDFCRMMRRAIFNAVAGMTVASTAMAGLFFSYQYFVAA